MLVKEDGSEFRMYWYESEEEGRRLAQELADLMEKPLDTLKEYIADDAMVAEADNPQRRIS